MIYSLSIDQDVAIMEATLDNELRTANNLFEMVMLQHDTNLANAEHKVFCESGTDEDLEMLYMEATEQVAQKSEGIIKRIFTAIKNFLSNITEKITSLFKSKEKNVDEKAKVKLDFNPEEIQAKANGLLAKAKQLIAKVKSGAKNAADEVANFIIDCNKYVMAGSVVLSGIGVYQGFKKLSNKTNDAKKQVDSLEKAAEGITDPEKVKLIQKITGAVSKVIKTLGNAAVTICSKIPVVGKAVKGAKKDDAVKDSTEETKLDATDEDATTESAEDEFAATLSEIVNGL